MNKNRQIFIRNSKILKLTALPQLCLAMLLGLLAFSVYAEEDKPNVGDSAPDFEIIQMDGTPFKLGDYKGKKAVYLVFWNTWCHYCMKKIPTLKNVEKNLANELKIIAVNTTNKDSLEQSLDFQKRFNINYSLAFDYGKKITDSYNVWGTPTEFIIDINGIIQFRDDIPSDISSYLKTWNTLNTSPTQTQP